MASGKLLKRKTSEKLLPIDGAAEIVMDKQKNKKTIFGGPKSQSKEHLADSTLLHALTFEFDNMKDQFYDNAISGGASVHVDPSQQMYVSGQLFFKICRLLYNQCGPQHVFFALQDAFVDQWTPIGVVFGSANTASITCERLKAYENLAHRSCISDIQILSDQSVSVRRKTVMQEIGDTRSQTMAYWGCITSVYRASGCRGIRLETADGLLFANGQFNAQAIDKFNTGDPITLSWDRFVEQTEPTTPRFRVPCHKKLVADFADHVLELFSSGKSVNLAIMALELGVSPRTLQRRLKEAGLSLCRFRRALQLFVATNLLAEPKQDLAYAAVSANFSDAPHLIREFRAATSMSPRDFANRLLL